MSEPSVRAQLIDAYVERSCTELVAAGIDPDAVAYVTTCNDGITYREMCRQKMANDVVLGAVRLASDKIADEVTAKLLKAGEARDGDE